MAARLMRFGLCFAALALLQAATAQAAEVPEIDLQTSIDDALAAREEAQFDILFEAALRDVPAVVTRIEDLKRGFDDRRISNSVCVASHRAEIGKTAFTCNAFDYDVLFLARESGQSAADNIAYIFDLADDPFSAALESGDPLHAGLAQAAAALKPRTSIPKIAIACDWSFVTARPDPSGGIFR